MPLAKLDCSEITEGVCYSAPVFFDDGVNMFLAERHPARRFHISVLERWRVPYLMTAGHKIDAGAPVAEVEPLDEFEDAEVSELETL